MSKLMEKRLKSGKRGKDFLFKWTWILFFFFLFCYTVVPCLSRGLHSHNPHDGQKSVTYILEYTTYLFYDRIFRILRRSGVSVAPTIKCKIKKIILGPSTFIIYIIIVLTFYKSCSSCDWLCVAFKGRACPVEWYITRGFFFTKGTKNECLFFFLCLLSWHWHFPNKQFPLWRQPLLAGSIPPLPPPAWQVTGVAHRRQVVFVSAD